MKSTGNPLPRIFRRGAFALLSSALLLPLFASVPEAQAQVTFSVQIGAPPVCPYGYFEYAPYSCAPPGFYGPGYFYNGIFLGVGPWANWGYAHGWGPHRFYRPGGGMYYPGYWHHHRYLHPGHYWDHPRGHAYGHYKHYDRDYDHHDNGRHGGRDYDHHDNGHHNGDHGHGHGHEH